MSQKSEQESNQAQTSAASQEDDWSNIKDPSERRKIQNRIAQRRFRDKAREQREENERNTQNRLHAGAAYTTPEPEEIDERDEGLPWGSISMRHVLETGRSREHQGSGESSTHAAVSKAGGSSRLGLHLIDQYARGDSAWAEWRTMLVGLAAAQSTQTTTRSEAPG